MRKQQQQQYLHFCVCVNKNNNVLNLPNVNERNERARMGNK